MASKMETSDAEAAPPLDAVVVGAGFGGIYMLKRLLELGLRARAYEAGEGVGGTWHWNRYPGARCDTRSVAYSYSFSDDLQQDWTWSEIYSDQREIETYANHVIDRYSLREHIRLSTRIAAAVYLESDRLWTLQTSTGESIRTKYCIMATGGYSLPHEPDIQGLDEFQGEKYLTSRWPDAPVSFARKRIAVIGCGLGGAAVSAMLQRSGFHVTAYEQAPGFSRLGAGIHLTPNVVKALEWAGLREPLIALACKPAAFTSRDAFTGEVIAQLPLGQAVVEQFGAPYLTVHRGDFHALMVDALRPGTLQFSKRLQSLSEDGQGVRLVFDDGGEAFADLVIGADGLSSVVRNTVCANLPPHFSGQAAFRALVDLKQLAGNEAPPDDLTKWWSDDRFVIAYYMNEARDQYYFVAGFPQDAWPLEVPSVAADRDEMMAYFADFHSVPRRLLAAAQDIRKWPLYERPVDPAWSRDRVVLLGDACHPMRPHMAQGAAMAIEDGAVLVRCLMAAGADNWPLAYGWYQDARKERVQKVQGISSENSWMRTTPDPAWLFSLDAWNFPLFAQKRA